MKVCSKCGDEKPLDQFSRRSDGRDGRRSDCRVCRSAESRKWREENPGASGALTRKWREENPGAEAARKRKWREENPGAEAARKRKWREENPEAARKDSAKRRAAYHEPYVYPQIDARTDGLCGICGHPVLPHESRHYDHVIPIARGGNDVPNNLILSHETCNLKKQAKTIKLAVDPKPVLPIEHYLGEAIIQV